MIIQTIFPFLFHLNKLILTKLVNKANLSMTSQTLVLNSLWIK